MSNGFQTGAKSVMAGNMEMMLAVLWCFTGQQRWLEVAKKSFEKKR